MKIEIFEYHVASPLSIFGLTHPFWSVNLDTLIYTWVGMLILFAIVLLGRTYLTKPSLTPQALLLEEAVLFFKNLCIESFGYFDYDYFAFIASLFFFTFTCNFIGILPFLEEPTADPFTTFAIGISSFVYVQYQKIRLHGFKEFIMELMRPSFFMAPIDIIGELAKVVSMSFRLFGNILGGAIVLQLGIGFLEGHQLFLMLSALVFLPIYILFYYFGVLEKVKFLRTCCNIFLGILFIVPCVQLFFGLFEGVIQAFVVAMLTMTYLSIIVAQDEPHEQASTGAGE